MTALDDRAVTTNNVAAAHLELLRVLGGILLDPTLEQPLIWTQGAWTWGPSLDGQFHQDGASLEHRRTQIRAYAVALGLEVKPERQYADNTVCIKAGGQYHGVDVSVWGTAPAENGGAA